MSSLLRVAALTGVVLFVCTGCPGAPAGTGELTISVRPRTIDNGGQTATISVAAVDAKQAPGNGSVRVTTTAGSLKDGTTVTLANGTADATFTCKLADDPACTGSVRITAEWILDGKLVEASSSINVTRVVDGGSDAGDTDAGFDAGSDAGTDAGVDAGNDAGTDAGPSDASITLSASKTRVFMGVGDFSDLTASMLANGSPAVGERIDFTTTLGQLELTDGGVGASVSETTGATGAATVRFVETGAAGTATVNALNARTGATASTSIEIVAVNTISYVATTCGGSACTIMGIRGSSFNETATVRFALKDSLLRAVPGVRVTFTALNAPGGTTVSPNAISDAQGNVDAVVQSGLTIGTFSIRATVIAGVLETTSPTIGVRGAKPSNLGFTLQCQRINMATYRSPTPPLPLTNTCTVTLVDRYGNPVGTGTSVRLNSEAGRVPNQVITTAFTPTGANTDEGKGSFTFDTTGPFPAEDVAPLALDAAQYPYQRDAEPRWLNGPLTQNPRDGLVTIIAYVQGEEHFFDDNNNGVRDANERFIDQGEPFVDRNDNNVWDPGEVYIDTNNDNAWTPANGVWDSNTTVWTKLFLLYTDVADPGAITASGWTAFVPGTPYNVAKGTSLTLDVYTPDHNLNHVEGGAGATVRHTATKGTVIAGTLNASLDTYGFNVEAQRLVNATGTGPCSPSEIRCIFKTIFGSWGRGFIGQVRIDGAPITDMTAPQADVLSFDTSVRTVTATSNLSGTIQ